MRYYDLFKDRVIIITGAGRSGTTIMGQIVGSMAHTYYLFEPAILKLLWPSNNGEYFRQVLFEDYFLPIIQGRGNPNKADWSYQGNYLTEDDIKTRQDVLGRRSDAMEYIGFEDPMFVIKLPEFQPYMEDARKVFPGCRFINVIRNGLDVVKSSIERGWYTDDWCNDAMVEQCTPKTDEYTATPMFSADGTVSGWNDMDQATRSANAWRVLTEAGIKHKTDADIEFSYEGFCEDAAPMTWMIANRLGLKQTDLTKQHVESVKTHVPVPVPDLDVNMIQEPERSKFMRLMGVLGYG